MWTPRQKKIFSWINYFKLHFSCITRGRFQGNNVIFLQRCCIMSLSLLLNKYLIFNRMSFTPSDEFYGFQLILTLKKYWIIETLKHFSYAFTKYRKVEKSIEILNITELTTYLVQSIIIQFFNKLLVLPIQDKK